MKKQFRLFVKIAAAILLVAAVVNFQLLVYGFGQLKGQIKIVLDAITIEEAIQNLSLTEVQKKKLLLVQEIRAFAFDSLQLKWTDNYTTFYDQRNKPILWVVTAAPRFQLKPYYWKFPMLGEVSYKGFFDKEKAEREFKKLEAMNLDADISTVSGWSTLGWFRDPVLSNMLNRSEGWLAETIIHELTHSTVYLKSNVDLNENLATFAGERGAELFLKMKFGDASHELSDYLKFREDEMMYGKHMLRGALRLDSLYHVIASGNYSVREKFYLKYRLIADILVDADTLPLNNQKRYRYNLDKRSLPNNTLFMGYSRYRKSQDQFQTELSEKFGNNLKNFIQCYAGLK